MKVLVAGGAGFVGRHLVRYLLDDGHKVTIFDNLSNSSRDNIMALTKRGAKFVQSDILNYKILLKHVRRNDFVIHLAAKIDVEESLSFPHITNSVNVDGTINVLRACVESKVKISLQHHLLLYTEILVRSQSKKMTEQYPFLHMVQASSLWNIMYRYFHILMILIVSYYVSSIFMDRVNLLHTQE